MATDSVFDTDDRGTSHTVFDRACLVLGAFEGPGQLSMAEVVRRTGLPRSSTHRMLEQLVQLRWLRRQGRHYALGLRLMELGSLAIHQDRLHSAAAPFLHELHQSTGYTVHLAILDGPDVIYLDKITAPSKVVLPSRIGGRHPAHCSALGKTMLAFGADSVAQESIDSLDLSRPRTPRSIAHPGALQTELGKVRGHGLAYDREEAVPGIGCVAAPIGHIGAAVAAVSITGPIAQLRLERRLPTLVRMSATDIWRAVDTDAVPPTLPRSRTADRRPADS